MFDEIRYVIQRGRRGYSDRDLWDFRGYLCDIIPPAMRSYKEGIGCPGELFDESREGNECHEWNKILEEIALDFERGKHKQGLKLFSKWFDYFWD